METETGAAATIVAITGGPCAGKTSSMEALRAHLEACGIQAVFVPEAATDLILEGVAPWTCESMLEFQTAVIARQLVRESEAITEARRRGADFVVCDRGICDSRAYLSREDYACALAVNGISEEEALARYDVVFHLDSIAKDFPNAYTQGNNAARFENAEEAVLADGRTRRAWEKHTRLRIIGNHASFDEKACALCRAVEHLADDGPILVSACLIGAPCRYDGKSQPCEEVVALAETRTLVPACPEQLGGLPTPRTPSEIQPDGRIVDASGSDNTQQFLAGARETLRIAREHGCTRAILKENSPSCGVRRVHDGSFSGTLISGSGVTAAMLAGAGIEVRSDK